MTTTKFRCSGKAAWLWALAVFALAVPAIANIEGAIFTTTATGTTVNGNIYANKADVYLGGGPQNTNSNGLPPGNYYFQVTDPSGTVLLSTDAIGCREVNVTDGRLAGVVAGSCPHQNGTFNPANGITPVQLIPFNDTPNPGGEYKVWLTPIAAYNGCSSSRRSFGFCDSDSKTDNFKVTSPNVAYVTVCKFNDFDGNHTQDVGEPRIPHWPVSATGVDGASNAQMDDTGCVSFTVTNFIDGSKTVTLKEGTFGDDWSQTAPLDDTYGACSVAGGVITCTLSPGDNVSAPDFGNTNPNCSVGCDLNSLIVTKDAYPSLQRTFTWGITKDVDKTEIDAAAGGNATFNYTVKVTHDAGIDSDWKVTGNIRVSNPGGAAVSGVNVTDTVDNGGSCEVTGGTNVTIPAGSHVDLPYTCTYVSAPAAGTNTATADSSLGSFTGTAPVDFSAATIAVTDGSVTVKDPLGGGSLGTVTSAESSPKSFTYSNTVTAPSGTCTTVPNTATFTTDDTGATGSASKSVKVCGGADLTVSKTASPTYKRTYNWSIGKAVDKTLVEQSGGTYTFNYTVNVNQTGLTDSEWVVTGNITVTNPNDWEAITVNVTDAVGNGGTCTVSGGSSVSVSASGSAIVPYTCTYASAPNPYSGTNTATATWNKSVAFTPAASAASGAVDSSFTTPTTIVNKTITVKDTFNSLTPTTLGTLTATDNSPFTSATYTYSHKVNNATGGQCLTYNNTATIVGTSQSANQSVTICNTATGALTMGYWQNKNGQGIISGGASSGGVCNSGTWLRLYAPFQDLSASANCSAVATYVYNIIKAANSSGAAMNAMLKGQVLATALDVYFSDPALGLNKIGAPNPIGGDKIDLTQVCKMIDGSSGSGTCSGTYQNASSVFGLANCLTVSQMLVYAAGQSNAGGSAWYGQVKATQELAKNAFDAINNQVAKISPTCP